MGQPLTLTVIIYGETAEEFSCHCNICRFENLCSKKKKKKISVFNLSSTSCAVFRFIWLTSPWEPLEALCSCRQCIHMLLCHPSTLCCIKNITDARGMSSCRFAELVNWPSPSVWPDGHWTVSKLQSRTRWSGKDKGILQLHNSTQRRFLSLCLSVRMTEESSLVPSSNVAWMQPPGSPALCPPVPLAPGLTVTGRGS